MRSPTRTCCPSASTTSTRSSCPGRRWTSRCRASTGSFPPWRRSASVRSSSTPRSLRPEDETVSDDPTGGRRVSGLTRSSRRASIEAARIYYNAFGRLQDEDGQGISGSRSASSIRMPQTRPSRTTSSTTRKASRPTAVRQRPRVPRGRDPGLQRDVRDEFRHLAEGSRTTTRTCFTTAEEPRDRPRHRGQHVSHRLRRHHAEHALGRQEPAVPRSAQAYSRTNRILNSVKTFGNIVSFRPRGGDKRRDRAVRQQGRPRRRPPPAVRPLLRVEYAAKVAELLAAYPSMLTSWGGCPEGVHRPVRSDPAAAQHPHVLRRLRRPGNPHASAGAGLHEYLPRPLRRVRRGRTGTRSRSSTTSSSKSSSSSRSRSTSTTSSCWSRSTAPPRATATTARSRSRSRGHRRQPVLRNKKDLIEEFVDSVSASGDMEPGVEGLYRRQARPRAGRHHR